MRGLCVEIGAKAAHLDSRIILILQKEGWKMNRKILRRSHSVMSPMIDGDNLGLPLGGRDIQILADGADGTLSLFDLRQLLWD